MLRVSRRWSRPSVPRQLLHIVRACGTQVLEIRGRRDPVSRRAALLRRRIQAPAGVRLMASIIQPSRARAALSATQDR